MLHATENTEDRVDHLVLVDGRLVAVTIIINDGRSRGLPPTVPQGSLTARSRPVTSCFRDVEVRVLPSEQVAEVLGLWRGEVVDRPPYYGVYLEHRKHAVVVLLHDRSPFEPPHVFIAPAPKNRHYYVHRGESQARLCFVQPGEWLPSFRLLTAVGCATRFLNDYLADRVR
jgi:hypothetical protein